MTSQRAYNFSSGPAMLPQAVMEKAQAEFLDYQGTGMSVMEMSHRSDAYMAIAAKAKADFIQLLDIPDTHDVLFMHGGASAQFAAIPMNLAQPGEVVDFVQTGMWSKKAVAEAGKYVRPNVVSATDGYIAPESEWQCDSNARMLHYASNETIAGVQFHHVPQTHHDILVADMSSDILSRPIDVSQFGVIFAGAQKNIASAGLAVVILRKDLLAEGRYQPQTALPNVLNYAQQAAADSMLNTPATYAWYLAGLVFEHWLDFGGLNAVAQMNQQKARLLYQTIDGSDFYHNPVDKSARSQMTVPFTLANPALDEVFLSQAEARGLLTLKGHRSTGGMRACLYNAMPLSGVQALVDFMVDFEQTQA